jgi:hypothetical protein
MVSQMVDARRAFVYEAELELMDATNPAQVGAAVTKALCGHWEHEGPCRWPHNNEVEVSADHVTFRTLFVAAANDEQDIRERIQFALQDGRGWIVLHTRSRPISVIEQPLAGRLLATSSQ